MDINTTREWRGYLTEETLEAVAARIRRIVTPQRRFTLVSSADYHTLPRVETGVQLEGCVQILGSNLSVGLSGASGFGHYTIGSSAAEADDRARRGLSFCEVFLVGGVGEDELHTSVALRSRNEDSVVQTITLVAEEHRRELESAIAATVLRRAATLFDGRRGILPPLRTLRELAEDIERSGDLTALEG